LLAKIDNKSHGICPSAQAKRRREPSSSSTNITAAATTGCKRTHSPLDSFYEHGESSTKHNDGENAQQQLNQTVVSKRKLTEYTDSDCPVGELMC